MHFNWSPSSMCSLKDTLIIGIVVASGNKDDSLLGERVFLVPMRGWEKDPEGPENKYALYALLSQSQTQHYSTFCRFYILGGGMGLGTFAQYAFVQRDQVILTPDHLDDVHMAAWPLGGVTAWR